MKRFAHTFSRLLLLGVLLCSTLLFTPPAANAQTVNGITLNIQAGLDGYYKSGSWMRVLVEAANEGPSVEGTLTTRFRYGDAFYTIPLSLPTQSNKRIEFYLPVEDLITDIPMELRDAEGNLLIESVSNSLSSLPNQRSLLYGVVSSQVDTLDLLENVTGRRVDAGVAHLEIENLPLDAAGWVPLDVLVFNDVDTNQLSLDQREALIQWIQLGGQLVVTGGASWQQTTAAVEELLPVTVDGTSSFNDLPQFSETVGEPYRDPGPYVVTTSSLRDGELIFREEGIPILARRSEGRGNVYFLALDPRFAPLDDWDGSEIMWEAVAKRINQPIMWEQGFVNESSVFEAISTIPSLTIPSPWLLFGFIATYIFLVGPINYVLLNRTNRRELAWFSIPVSIVLFSAVAFVIGLQFKGNRVILNQMSVISGQAGGPAVYNTAIGVYSPNRNSFDLELAESPLTYPLNRFGFGNNGTETNITYGTQTEVSDFLVDVGGVFPVSTYRVEPQHPIEGEVILSSDGSSGALRVANTGETSLENVIILIGASSVRLERIEAGQTIEREINIPSGFRDGFLETARNNVRDFQLTTPVGSGSYIESPLEKYYSNILADESGNVFVDYDIYNDSETFQRYELLQGLYDQYGSTELYTPLTSVTLIGWSESETIDVTIDTSRFDREAVSIYFIEIPLELQ
ncbi:MAG: hypothetical protein AAF633_01500 [Chloroflexota bacterium]